jgi:uncharacterized membrane protein HdeD (DUF308 family)
MTSHPLLAGIESARKNWGWFLVLGIALVVLGAVIVSAPYMGTVLSIFWFGCFLLAAAFFEIISAFQSRGWGGFFLNLAEAALFGLAGMVMLRHPGESIVILTLMMAAYFLVSGIFSIIAGIAAPLPHRGWVILSGVVGVILGIMIWSKWPGDSLFYIGLFVGIDLIFRGWAWIMFAFAAKRLPTTPAG